MGGAQALYIVTASGRGGGRRSSRGCGDDGGSASRENRVRGQDERAAQSCAGVVKEGKEKEKKEGNCMHRQKVNKPHSVESNGALW